MSATGRPVRVLCVYCIGASLAGAAKQWTVRDLPCPYEDPLTDGHGTKVPPFQRGSLSSARHSVEGIIDKARHLRWIKAEAPETAYTTSQRTPIGPFN